MDACIWMNQPDTASSLGDRIMTENIRPPMAASNVNDDAPIPGRSQFNHLAINADPPPMTADRSSFAHLRITPDPEIDVEQVITTIRVERPGRNTFFRVHADWVPPSYWVLERKDPTEYYVVDIKAVPELVEEAAIRMLVPGITRDGDLFIWPVKTPDHDRPETWAESARAAVKLARPSWIKIRSNMRARRYDILRATGYTDEPEWPIASVEEMINLAFEGRVINSPEHPVVKALRGEG
jgi:hypothetical protein